MPQTLLLRSMVPTDWPGIWGLLEPVFRAGETFPHDPAITEAEAHHQWVGLSQVVVVALAADAQNSDGVQAGEGPLLGTYYLKPNSLTLGAHVANAGYVVAEAARRRGIGTRLCQHSLQEAQRLGYRAMQFNLVVSTNTAGLACWQANGFRIVGTLPRAFQHQRFGDVDAHVLFCPLPGLRHAD
jgi:L-amino acid N-acyltransferase YncA